MAKLSSTSSSISSSTSSTTSNRNNADSSVTKKPRSRQNFCLLPWRKNKAQKTTRLSEQSAFFESIPDSEMGFEDCEETESEVVTSEEYMKGLLPSDDITEDSVRQKLVESLENEEYGAYIMSMMTDPKFLKGKVVPFMVDLMKGIREEMKHDLVLAQNYVSVLLRDYPSEEVFMWRYATEHCRFTKLPVEKVVEQIKMHLNFRIGRDTRSSDEIEKDNKKGETFVGLPQRLANAKLAYKSEFGLSEEAAALDNGDYEYNPFLFAGVPFKVFFTKEGRPVEYWNVKKMFEEVNLSEMQTCLKKDRDHLEDMAFAWMEKRQKFLQGVNVANPLLIMDFDGVSTFQLVGNANRIKPAVKIAIKVAEFYPSTYSKMYFCNTGFSFSSVLKIASTLTPIDKQVMESTWRNPYDVFAQYSNDEEDKEEFKLLVEKIRAKVGGEGESTASSTTASSGSPSLTRSITVTSNASTITEPEQEP